MISLVPDHLKVQPKVPIYNTEFDFTKIKDFVERYYYIFYNLFVLIIIGFIILTLKYVPEVSPVVVTQSLNEQSSNIMPYNFFSS